MTKIGIDQLRQLVVAGITTEELNSKYDYSHITNMSNLFYGCYSLTSIPLLDTSNVRYMRYMFWGCSSLTSIPSLDTSNVIDMGFMFSGCQNLKEVDPYNFHLYNWSKLDNKFLKEKYPELYI